LTVGDLVGTTDPPFINVTIGPVDAMHAPQRRRYSGLPLCYVDKAAEARR